MSPQCTPAVVASDTTNALNDTGDDTAKPHASIPATMPEPADPPIGAKFERLVDIMRTLRAPDGCPWDREQTLASLRPFVLEEAYEVLDAIDRADTAALCDELGDLIFEAIFLAQLCAEEGQFPIADALDAAATTLIRRHPHVFGDGERAGAGGLTAADVKRRWEEIKAGEREAAGQAPSLLGSVPPTLPALLRAYRIGKRTVTVGFDWTRPDEVLRKVREELSEVEAAIGQGAPHAIEDEIGDLLFAVANLARHLGIEPEGALSRATRKFSDRFAALEQSFRARGRALRDVSADEMDQTWTAIKRTEQ